MSPALPNLRLLLVLKFYLRFHSTYILEDPAPIILFRVFAKCSHALIQEEANKNYQIKKKTSLRDACFTNLQD